VHNNSYRGLGGLEFDRVIRTPRGFGGVIFGSEVVAAHGTPLPTALFWIPLPSNPPIRTVDGKVDVCPSDDDCAAWGRLLARLDDNRQVVTSATRAEDVYVAGCLVYGGRPRVSAITPGNSVQRFGTTAGGGDAVERADRWFSSSGQTWKITDVPRTIRLEGRRLIVERTPLQGAVLPPDLARTAFLDFVGFSNSAAADEGFMGSNEHFTRLVPILARSVAEFERLNEFAKVFSIMR
jgi:hypothetical protein